MLQKEKVTPLTRAKPSRPSFWKLNEPFGKKGILGYEAVMTIVRTIMLVFTLLSLVVVANVFIVRHIDTRFAESHTLMNLAYYSNEGLAYVDAETGRVYPGSVDPAKDPELESSFSYGEESFDLGPFIAARFTAQLPIVNKEFYYRQELFKDWNFLYRAGLTKGVGGINKVSALRKMSVYSPSDSSHETVSTTLEVVSRNA